MRASARDSFGVIPTRGFEGRQKVGDASFGGPVNQFGGNHTARVIIVMQVNCKQAHDVLCGLRLRLQNGGIRVCQLLTSI